MHLDPLRIAVAILGLVLAAAGSGCSGGNDRADAETAVPGQGTQLRSLERPVVRHLKLAFIALSRHRNAVAADELEAGVRSGRRVTAWLDGHEAYVDANRDTVECAEHAVPELGELAERETRELRDGAPASRRLRVQITEVVTCLQASD